MFQSKIVFVVGAGGSADLGLPLGFALRDEIVRVLAEVGSGQIKTEGGNAVLATLRSHARRSGEAGGLTPYRRAAILIAQNLPLVRSIDEFIDHHNGEKEIEFVAKVAICWLILSAEEKSLLLRGNAQQQALNIRKMQEQDSWHLELWNLLRAGSHVSDPRAPFTNVSFLVFNYDRCLEVFFIQALTSMFRVTVAEARNIVAEVPIIHPYGSVGSLEGATGGVPFGETENINLGQLAANIRTFGESERDAEKMGQIEGLIGDAAKIVFVGFAFHDQNMDFFESRSSPKPYPKVYASALNLPQENWPDIRVSLIKQMKRSGHSGGDFSPIFRDCRGAELLRIYDKPLRR